MYTCIHAYTKFIYTRGGATKTKAFRPVVFTANRACGQVKPIYTRRKKKKKKDGKEEEALHAAEAALFPPLFPLIVTVRTLSDYYIKRRCLFVFNGPVQRSQPASSLSVVRKLPFPIPLCVQYMSILVAKRSSVCVKSCASLSGSEQRPRCDVTSRCAIPATRPLRGDMALWIAPRAHDSTGCYV